METFFTSPFYPIIVSVIVAVIVAVITGYLTYYFALRRFYREKQYQNKLDKYQVLVDTMRGFVRGVNEQQAKQKFTDYYRAIWLCGSPAVVRLITKFYNTYIDRPDLENNEKQKIMTDCLLEAVIEMRRDLNTQGKLKKIEDFDLYV